MPKRPIYGTVSATELAAGLEQMASERVERRKSHAEEMLGPLADKLLKMYAEGKTYQNLAEGLARIGFKIPVSTLREHMAKWRIERKKRRPAKR